MKQLKQIIRKTGLLICPVIIFLGMTNCSQFQSFSDAQKVKFLSENPIFSNINSGQDPHDDRNRPPIICALGYTLNPQGTACIPITCQPGQRLTNGVCRNIVCPPDQTLNSDQTACVPIGNTNQCTLLPGQIRVGNQCQCPQGKRLNNAGTACIPIGNTNQCTLLPGQIRVGNQCQCPQGKRLNNAGTACIPIGNTNQCTLLPGQIRANGTCQNCPSGYRPNSSKTACVPIQTETTTPTKPTSPRNSGGDGGDGGGDGGGCPLMIDSQGVEYADFNQLRNSDDSYFNSGELSLSAPTEGIKFNLLGKQTKAKLNNGDFLHIQPQAHNFKFQISWTQTSQSRYRWLTLPDENGHINGIDELFGDNTFGPDSENPFAKDGFRALMKWDRGNASDSSMDFADGYIDANDAVFSKLRLWHDLNGDGNCDTEEEISSELVSLSEVGINYIHLSVNENFFETDVYGNNITYKSLVGFRASEQGATRLGTAFDIWFKYDPSEILSTGKAQIRKH